jgi:hypothetical protein
MTERQVVNNSVVYIPHSRNCEVVAYEDVNRGTVEKYSPVVESAAVVSDRKQQALRLDEDSLVERET